MYLSVLGVAGNFARIFFLPFGAGFLLIVPSSLRGGRPREWAKLEPKSVVAHSGKDSQTDAILTFGSVRLNYVRALRLEYKGAVWGGLS